MCDGPKTWCSACQNFALLQCGLPLFVLLLIDQIRDGSDCWYETAAVDRALDLSWRNVERSVKHSIEEACSAARILMNGATEPSFEWCLPILCLHKDCCDTDLLIPICSLLSPVSASSQPEGKCRECPQTNPRDQVPSVVA